MTSTRTCSSCGQTKPLETEFYPQSNGRGGYASNCRTCNNRNRKPTVTRLVRTRARGRAMKALAERHAEEFEQLLEAETVKAQAEHDLLAAAAAEKGHHDAPVARMRTGPKRTTKPETAVDRLDVARCPQCHTHHAADHQCPTCGDVTGQTPPDPVLLGRKVPAHQVREWAYIAGIECAPKGPIAREVLAAYQRAHAKQGVS